MKVTTVGLDIAKHVFQLHGVDEQGNVVLRRRLRRDEVAPFFANLPACRVGLEACGGAHYWARRLIRFGHTVRLIAPQFVKPYVKSNKNDISAISPCTPRNNDGRASCQNIPRSFRWRPRSYGRGRLASERLVLLPSPNKKRGTATEAAKPSSDQSTNFSLRTLFIRFVLRQLHPPLNDPVHAAHQRQHAAEGERHGFHGQRGSGWQRPRSQRLAAGQKREIDIRNVEHGASAHVVLAPYVVDIYAGIVADATMRFGEKLVSVTKNRSLGWARFRAGGLAPIFNAVVAENAFADVRERSLPVVSRNTVGHLLLSYTTAPMSVF